jgi:hypothetical protein
MVTVASRDAAHVPSVARALGCRVSPDRQHVAVFLLASQSATLLRDLRETGAIAAVFSQPSTHRTIQLKGSDALLGAIEPAVPDEANAALRGLRARRFPRASRAHSAHALDVVASASPRRPHSSRRGPQAGRRLHADRRRDPGEPRASSRASRPPAADGTPNATYVSQVHYVDATHIALTYQFFSKTRENVLANPRVTLYLVHPVTLARYRIAARYLRTETAGPLFESMKAKLAGIASHRMTGVFKLRGADVYRVESVTEIYRTSLILRRRGELLAQRAHIARRPRPRPRQPADGLPRCVRGHPGSNAMVLMRDTAGEKLYGGERGYRIRRRRGNPAGRGRDRHGRTRKNAHSHLACDVGVRLRARHARGCDQPRPDGRHRGRDPVPGLARVAEPDRSADPRRRTPARGAVCGKRGNRAFRL